MRTERKILTGVTVSFVAWWLTSSTRFLQAPVVVVAEIAIVPDLQIFIPDGQIKQVKIEAHVTVHNLVKKMAEGRRLYLQLRQEYVMEIGGRRFPSGLNSRLIRLFNLLPGESEDFDLTASTNMDSWLLRDAGGRVWALTSMGTIGAGASATIQRNGMPMSLNNTGPEAIELLDAGGRQVVDSFSYQGSQPNVAIQTMH